MSVHVAMVMVDRIRLSPFRALQSEICKRNEKAIFVCISFSPFAVRAVNDQLMLLERAFIEPQGMPGKPYHRSVTP